MDFTEAEAADWGGAVRDASDLVKQITGCERAIVLEREPSTFSASHSAPSNDPLPRHVAVADLYRAMDLGDRAAADPAAVASLVQRCRVLIMLRLKRLRVLLL